MLSWQKQVSNYDQMGDELKRKSYREGGEGGILAPNGSTILHCYRVLVDACNTT